MYEDNDIRRDWAIAPFDYKDDGTKDIVQTMKLKYGVVIVENLDVNMKRSLLKPHLHLSIFLYYGIQMFC